MTNLMMRDWRALRKPQIWLVLLVNALLWDVLSPQLQSVAFVGPVLAFQFILLIDLYDMTQKNAQFMNSLPVRRRTFVLAKYAEGALLILFGYVLAFLMELPVFLAKGFQLFSFTYLEFVRGLTFALVMLAVYLFVQFRMKSDNMEISFGSALVVAVVFGGLVIVLLRHADPMGMAAKGLVLGVVLVAALLLYAFSLVFSTRNYQRRDI